MASPQVSRRDSGFLVSSELLETEAPFYDSIPRHQERSTEKQATNNFDHRHSLPGKDFRRTLTPILVVIGSAMLLGVVLTARSTAGLTEKDTSFSTKTFLMPFPSQSLQQQMADSVRNELNFDDRHTVRYAKSETNVSLGNIPKGCEGTVLIVRPCEKDGIKDHCSYVGYERSVYLASLFGSALHERYPQPSYLIAESPRNRRHENRKNVRELQTLIPLARKFNLPIDTSYSTLETHDLKQHVHDLFHNGDMCGKLMVISWKHAKIPHLSAAFGCGIRDGCPLDYPAQGKDFMLQIKFVYQKESAQDHGRWMLYGHLQQQGFDPLAFSKLVGDYPRGGTPAGGRWRDPFPGTPE